MSASALQKRNKVALLDDDDDDDQFTDDETTPLNNMTKWVLFPNYYYSLLFRNTQVGYKKW